MASRDELILASRPASSGVDCLRMPCNPLPGQQLHNGAANVAFLCDSLEGQPPAKKANNGEWRQSSLISSHNHDSDALLGDISWNTTSAKLGEGRR